MCEETRKCIKCNGELIKKKKMRQPKFFKLENIVHYHVIEVIQDLIKNWFGEKI